MFGRILSRFLLWKSTTLSPVKVRFNFRVSVCEVCYPELDEIEGMTPRWPHSGLHTIRLKTSKAII